MSSLRDVPPGEASAMLSHDELMLKELERRDGIYSFIFHELESPKASTPQAPPITAAAAAKPPADKHSQAANFMEVPDAPSASTIVTTVTSSTSVITTALTTSATAAATVANASLFPQHYHEFLKAWHPPPTLVYNHPKLYAYMANCGFRVRIPTPRFSHLSAPLVRNRRHVLKDAPAYKWSDDVRLCALKMPPDLRALFPHDPDVHAPFSRGGRGGGGADCNGAAATTVAQ